MVHDMHTRRRRPDYIQACPTGPPVDGVKYVLTPALWPCTYCSDPLRLGLGLVLGLVMVRALIKSVSTFSGTLFCL